MPKLNVAALLPKAPLSPLPPPAAEESHEDTSALYCLCQRPFSESLGFMIQCDVCNDWYHGSCVGLKPEEGEKLPHWECPLCKEGIKGKKVEDMTEEELEDVPLSLIRVGQKRALGIERAGSITQSNGEKKDSTGKNQIQRKMFPVQNKFAERKTSLTDMQEQAIRVKIENGLAEVLGSELGKSIENALFQHFKSTQQAYRDQYRDIIQNLKDSKNPDFKQKIISLELKPENLVKMTSDEMASKEVSEWRDSVVQNSIKNSLLPPVEAVIIVHNKGNLLSSADNNGINEKAAFEPVMVPHYITVEEPVNELPSLPQFRESYNEGDKTPTHENYFDTDEKSVSKSGLVDYVFNTDKKHKPIKEKIVNTGASGSIIWEGTLSTTNVTLDEDAFFVRCTQLAGSFIPQFPIAPNLCTAGRLRYDALQGFISSIIGPYSKRKALLVSFSPTSPSDNDLNFQQYFAFVKYYTDTARCAVFDCEKSEGWLMYAIPPEAPNYVKELVQSVFSVPAPSGLFGIILLTLSKYDECCEYPAYTPYLPDPLPIPAQSAPVLQVHSSELNQSAPLSSPSSLQSATISSNPYWVEPVPTVSATSNVDPPAISSDLLAAVASLQKALQPLNLPNLSVAPMNVGLGPPEVATTVPSLPPFVPSNPSLPPYRNDRPFEMHHYPTNLPIPPAPYIQPPNHYGNPPYVHHAPPIPPVDYHGRALPGNAYPHYVNPNPNFPPVPQHRHYNPGPPPTGNDYRREYDDRSRERDRNYDPRRDDRSRNRR